MQTFQMLTVCRVDNKKRFYKTQAWKNTSRLYMQSVGGLCEDCLSKGIITPAEAVHHIKPLTNENIDDFDISLNWENLRALCRTCHAAAHKEINRQSSGRRYTIDASGRVTTLH